MSYYISSACSYVIVIYINPTCINPTYIVRYVLAQHI